jgi:Uma2 family endonuclease
MSAIAIPHTPLPLKSAGLQAQRTPPDSINLIGPAPYRWTLDAYRELGSMRLFDGLKTMLIYGKILVMALPAPPHNLSLGLAEDWLKAVFSTGYHVRNQMALDIGTENDPGPDLAVVEGTRRDYADRQATTALLVVEVADTSLFLDTTTKVELYATAGVPEYWVIDLANRQLLVFRDPEVLPAGLGATTYRTLLTYSPTDSVSPLAAPHASVKVADLLP